MERKEIIQRLKNYIKVELLHNPSYPLEDDEPLITGGLIDSFSLVQLSAFIEEAFDVRIPDTELTVDVMDTLEAMASNVIRHRTAGNEG